MFGQKQKSLLYRVMNFLVSLTIGGGLLAYFVHPDVTVALWAMSIALLIVGGYFCVIPFGGFTEREPVNRWYRAANRAGWILCELAGALLIILAVAMMVGQALGQGLSVAGVVGDIVVIAELPLVLLALLGVGGLFAIAYIAQGNEETRQWSRQWSQGHRNAPAGSAEHDPPAVGEG